MIIVRTTNTAVNFYKPKDCLVRAAFQPHSTILSVFRVPEMSPVLATITVIYPGCFLPGSWGRVFAAWGRSLPIECLREKYKNLLFLHFIDID